MNIEKTEENELENPQIANVNEPSAWDLRQEWRSAYNTCKRIRTHVAKLKDGRHTLLTDNGIELILAELTKLSKRMKEIEEIFKIKRWSL